MHYLIEYYEQTSTHNYILGVCTKGRVKAYLVTLDFDGLQVIFNEKPTSTKRQTVIKYRSTKAKIEWLEVHAHQIIDLMSLEELKATCRKRLNREGKEYTENCGECFEWLMAQYFHTSQNAQSNLKHTNGGDLVINGTPYQVKYEKGGIMVRV